MQGAEFVAGLANTWNDFDPTRMFHHAVMGGAVNTMQMLLEAYPEARLENRLTRDGTALHLAAYIGKPDMIVALIAAGADVNASSSEYDLVSATKAERARQKTDISVMEVPWRYQSKTQEFTPADVYHAYCPFAQQGQYAEQSEVAVLLDGHLAQRHGTDYLGYTHVWWDPYTGDQYPCDREAAARLRAEALREDSDLAIED